MNVFEHLLALFRGRGIFSALLERVWEVLTDNPFVSLFLLVLVVGFWVLSLPPRVR